MCVCEKMGVERYKCVHFYLDTIDIRTARQVVSSIPQQESLSPIQQECQNHRAALRLPVWGLVENQSSWKSQISSANSQHFYTSKLGPIYPNVKRHAFWIDRWVENPQLQNRTLSKNSQEVCFKSTGLRQCYI